MTDTRGSFGYGISAPPKNVWGPPAWAKLHAIASRYSTTTDLEGARQTFRAIWATVRELPCAECRAHATQYILATPPDLSSRTALMAWTWAFHNTVNARLGKPFMPYTTFDYLWNVADGAARASAYRVH